MPRPTQLWAEQTGDKRPSEVIGKVDNMRRKRGKMQQHKDVKRACKRRDSGSVKASRKKERAAGRKEYSTFEKEVVYACIESKNSTRQREVAKGGR